MKVVIIKHCSVMKLIASITVLSINSLFIRLCSYNDFNTSHKPLQYVYAK